MKSSCQVRVKADPMGVAIKIIAVMKITPRRPQIRLSGSESQTPRPAEATGDRRRVQDD